METASSESRRLKNETEDFLDQRLASFEILLEPYPSCCNRTPSCRSPVWRQRLQRVALELTSRDSSTKTVNEESMTSSPQTPGASNQHELVRHPGSERSIEHEISAEDLGCQLADNLKLQEMSLLRSPPLPPPMMLQSQVLLRFRGVVSAGDV